MERKSMGGKAILPILVFLVMSLGTAIAVGDSRIVPALVFFVIAAAVAILMNKERPLWDKIDTFCEGFGNKNIIMMVMIFLLAGAFSGISKEAGAVESVVNFFLNFMPTELIVGGMFLIGCFMSIATGTSVGTVVALGPIAMGVVEATGLDPAFVIGACISGGMFGDNLSFVSDTTISATRICGVEMKDKFKANFLLALPAAVIAFAIFTARSSGLDIAALDELQYDIVKIIPYLAVIGGSLAGLNVFVVLLLGIILSSGIGLAYGAFNLVGLGQAFYAGMMGMAAISLVVLIVGGMIALIKYNGGIDWILGLVKSKIKNRKQAEYAIAFLTWAVTMCTANSTVAIVTAGDIAMEITEEYKVDPRRTASLLDIFACGTMGTLVPYGGMMLAAAGAAGIDSMEVIAYATYPQVLLVLSLIAIALNFPKMKPLPAKEKVEQGA